MKENYQHMHTAQTTANERKLLTYAQTTANETNAWFRGLLCFVPFSEGTDQFSSRGSQEACMLQNCMNFCQMTPYVCLTV